MSISYLTQVPFTTYQNIIKANIIRPSFRLFILHPDETIKEDITEYLMLGTGSLSINYNNGQRRSTTFDLDNRTGQFTPSILGKIWINTKFRLELGIIDKDGNEIYSPAGIFVLSNPNTARTGAEFTISIQAYDKFALLDGTLGGNLEAVYEIPAGTSVRNAIENTLLLDNGNGYPVDTKSVIFDLNLINRTTKTIISKSPNDSIGSIFIDLANMFGADIWYDTEGHLNFISGIEDISQSNKPNLWTYRDTELEYIGGDTTYNFEQVKNRVVVAGCNVNGDYIYTGVAENNNPLSPTRISVIGTKNIYYEDANIYSEELAKQRAEYELNKISILQQTINLQSTYMIHLDVNNCIQLTDSFYDFYETRFLIQSIDIPIDIESVITISCTNIGALPFYNL